MCCTSLVRAQCPEFNLNLSIQHHETFCECKVAKWGLLVRFVFSLWLCRSALGFLSLRSSCFTSDITAALAFPASLRALRCLSRCGAFSLVGAQPCCSVSTRGSACTHLWEARAGGNLGTRNTMIYDQQEPKVLADMNTDIVFLCHKETDPE